MKFHANAGEEPDRCTCWCNQQQSNWEARTGCPTDVWRKTWRRRGPARGSASWFRMYSDASTPGYTVHKIRYIAMRAAGYIYVYSESISSHPTCDAATPSLFYILPTSSWLRHAWQYHCTAHFFLRCSFMKKKKETTLSSLGYNVF